jgi:hypothetical protein
LTVNLKTYMQQVVQPADAHDLWGAKFFRRLTTWFFEFTRNVMILGVLKYISAMSASPTLDAFYWLALGMMLLYTYSCTNMLVRVRPFAFLGDNMLSRVLDHAFNLAFGFVLFLLSILSIHVAISEISKFQG